MVMPTRFEVWAPRAQAARLIVDGVTVEMFPDAVRAEWWLSPLTPRVGQRYAFQLFDGSRWTQPLPDPRSPRQPDGVHGASQVVENRFAWTDAQWRGRELAGLVLYELHVGTFTPAGTFAGVVDKLGYLAELGVTAIELMPVAPFGGTRNWGYDGVGWFAVQESYGGPRGLKDLVNAAHKAGISIILDVVYNHFGPDGNYTGLFGPYTTTAATSWGEVVNLSGEGSLEVRACVRDAVRQWLSDFHIDGLRLDAVHAFDDRLTPSIMEEIRSVADEVEAATGIPRLIIAESDLNDPRLITDRARGGYGLDAQWLDDVHHALHSLISGERTGYYCDYGSLEILADTLRHGYRFRGHFSQYRGRVHGTALDLAHIPPARLISYTTTHDQTGNRALGDRPSMSLSPRQLVLKAAVILFAPFTPMLFMGEEFAAQTPFPFFVSHTDDRLNALTREGRLREFARHEWVGATVPDPAAEDTFTSARLDWEFTAAHKEMLAAYRRLIELRRQWELAARDLRELNVTSGAGWLCMAYEDVCLVANLSANEVTVPHVGRETFSHGVIGASPHATRLAPWGCAILATGRR